MNLIQIDKKDWEYTAIDTDAWLDRVCGENMEAWQEHLEKLDDMQDSYRDLLLSRGQEDEAYMLDRRPYTGKYWINSPEMQRAIAMFLEQQTEQTWVPAHDIENVYNSENDFSRVFQYQVWVPQEAAKWDAKAQEWRSDEWYYADDVYVAIERHMGGDVRGNYSTVQLRKPDYSYGGLAEGGFLDWTVGWYVTRYEASDKRHVMVPDGDQYDAGYHPSPTYHLSNALRSRPMWSEKRQCFVGWLDRRAVEIHPTCRGDF